MLGNRIGLPYFGSKGGVSDAADGSTFSPADVANAVAFYDVSSLTSLYVERTSPTTQASVDGVVGNIQDLTGNTRHLVPVSDGARPTLRQSSGVTYLEFNGTNSNARMTMTLAQPMTRVSLLQQISWSASDQILDGGSIDSCRVYQSGSSPTFLVRSVSGIITPSPMPAIGAWFVLTEVFNGASSKVKINNGSYVTGTLGGTAPNGFTVGGRGDGAGTVYSNIGWGGTVITSDSMSDDDVAACVEFFAAKGGITL